MNTLNTITEICRLLEDKGLTVEESMQVLEDTRQLLGFSQHLHEHDVGASPAAVIASAKERIMRINQRSRKKT